MSNSFNKARELGKCFWNVEAFEERCTEYGCSTMRYLYHHASALRKLHSERNVEQYVEYVSQCMMKTALLRAFYFNGPMDAFVRSSFPFTVDEQGVLFDLFDQAICYDDFDHADTLSCNLCFALNGFRSVVNTPPLALMKLTRLITTLCKLGSGQQEMLCDPVLWESLALQLDISVSSTLADAICRAALGILVIHNDQTIPLLHDTLTSVVVAAMRWIAAHAGAHTNCTAHFIVHTLEMSALWRSLTVASVAALVAHKWRWEQEGNTYAHILQAGASTELLLHLHRHDLLSGVIRFAHEHNDSEVWTAFLHDWRRMWPECIDEICKLPAADLPPESERSPYECPITLERCIRPVVASDGRIYERNAILSHMMTSNKSPITKQPLLHALVNLYS